MRSSGEKKQALLYRRSRNKAKFRYNGPFCGVAGSEQRIIILLEFKQIFEKTEKENKNFNDKKAGLFPLENKPFPFHPGVTKVYKIINLYF